MFMLIGVVLLVVGGLWSQWQLDVVIKELVDTKTLNLDLMNGWRWQSAKIIKFIGAIMVAAEFLNLARSIFGWT